jgi:formylglycine-generating enzyme required for sulfatase activity
MHNNSRSSLSLSWFFAVLTFVSSGCEHRASPPREQTKQMSQTNSIGMVLVSIPSGSFLMGNPRSEETSPVHRVTISGFGIGKYEVTNAEYDRYKERPRAPESLEDRQPASQISWQDAVDFCEWLSKKEGRSYRLSTEAEWEYAARGGLVQKDYPWGDASADGRARAGELTTAIVGRYPPNGWGLHDVAGNVDEWVSDWLDPNYYNRSPEKDPRGPSLSPPGGTAGELHGVVVTQTGNLYVGSDRHASRSGSFHFSASGSCSPRARHIPPKVRRNPCFARSQARRDTEGGPRVVPGLRDGAG